MTGVLHVWPLLLAACAWVYGRVDRVVERARFKYTMTRHGYSSHGQYVNGHEWKTRRGAFIRARHWPPCWCCHRRFRPEFPIHHLDYSRAGFGQELDRDLRLVCQPCHTRFHRWDRRRGLLRACGVSLRWVTYMVWVTWLPVRLIRGLGR